MGLFSKKSKEPVFDLSLIDDLVEAIKKFHLFVQKNPQLLKKVPHNILDKEQNYLITDEYLQVCECIKKIKASNSLFVELDSNKGWLVEDSENGYGVLLSKLHSLYSEGGDVSNTLILLNNKDDSNITDISNHILKRILDNIGVDKKTIETKILQDVIIPIASKTRKYISHVLNNYTLLLFDPETVKLRHFVAQKNLTGIEAEIYKNGLGALIEKIFNHKQVDNGIIFFTDLPQKPFAEAVKDFKEMCRKEHSETPSMQTIEMPPQKMVVPLLLDGNITNNSQNTNTLDGLTNDTLFAFMRFSEISNPTNKDVESLLTHLRQPMAHVFIALNNNFIKEFLTKTDPEVLNNASLHNHKHIIDFVISNKIALDRETWTHLLKNTPQNNLSSSHEKILSDIKQQLLNDWVAEHSGGGGDKPIATPEYLSTNRTSARLNKVRNKLQSEKPKIKPE